MSDRSAPESPRSFEEPTTDYDSKLVMIRGERGDTIDIDRYGEWAVTRRTDAYFGPKLLLAPENSDRASNVLLTAPGPDRHLYLWFPKDVVDGFQSGWVFEAEVTAELVDTKKYPICTACGEPMKTLEHQREAAFGVCTNV